MNEQIKVVAVYDNDCDTILFYTDECDNTYDTDEIDGDRLEAIAKAAEEDKKEPEYEHDPDEYATYLIDEWESMTYSDWDDLTGCSYEQHILSEIDYRLGK